MGKELLFSATKKDFKLDWFSGSGAGGQHRNKHQNCLRLTYLPANITVVSQTERDRPSNLRNAFKRIAPLILTYWLGEKKNERYKFDPNRVVRTYNEPDNRVTDSLTKFKQTYKEVVLDNNISNMIEQRKLGFIKDAS